MYFVFYTFIHLVVMKKYYILYIILNIQRTEVCVAVCGLNKAVEVIENYRIVFNAVLILHTLTAVSLKCTIYITYTSLS